MIYHCCITYVYMTEYFISLDACCIVSFDTNTCTTQAAGTQLLGAPAKGGSMAVHAFMEVNAHRNTGTYVPQPKYRHFLTRCFLLAV